jgi:hypothetical protein
VEVRRCPKINSGIQILYSGWTETSIPLPSFVKVIIPVSSIEISIFVTG